MKVLITGATGLVGREIAELCFDKGIEVHYLSTSKHKLNETTIGKGFYWDPQSNVIDDACFEGVSAIINLAGSSIAKRWTPSYKQKIIRSRIDGLNLIYDRLENISHQVSNIISASAIGIYPSSQTKYYEEDETQKANSFLGTVVEQWESTVQKFSNLGCKVSIVRIGLVLSQNGGVFEKMSKPISLGVGAPFGDGKQWQSWIHVEDLADIFLFVLENKITGVINGVAPNPVSNSELTSVIAKQMGKPIILPKTPKFAMQLVLGEMHQLLFESQRVSCKRLESLGFVFEYHHLAPAIHSLL
ncbi:MAG: TIGR01777 family protein [Bacteroidetes bacterium MedPE-SWsnd-G2]|nr:MAG: TIGR01777 family protein [Bacteroidetes bacterium MedPE-SWsnd-G2]